jgi:hypothetical protein
MTIWYRLLLAVLPTVLDVTVNTPDDSQVILKVCYLIKNIIQCL